MQSPPAKPRYALLLFIPVFLLYGVMASAQGYYSWQDWPASGLALRLWSVLTTVAGPLMLISAVWVLVSLGRRSLALQMGGLATAFFGLLQVIGSLTEIVPCSLA